MTLSWRKMRKTVVNIDGTEVHIHIHIHKHMREYIYVSAKQMRPNILICITEIKKHTLKIPKLRKQNIK